MISIFDNVSLKKINSHFYFEILTVLLFFTFGGLGWYYNYSISGMGIISLLLVLLLVFNDFKYVIPAGISLIFSYNGGYDSKSLPSQVALYVGLLFLIIVVYFFVNLRKERTKKTKSVWGFILLSSSCIIPVFWNSVITSETKIMYLIYFSWLLYVIVYFIFLTNFGKNSLRMSIFTISTLSLLLFFESITALLDAHYTHEEVEIISLTYTLGWGNCNEAGIMFCFCMPFVIYEMTKTKNSVFMFFDFIKIVFCFAGIFVSTSRASMLFGSIEFIVLLILLIIFSKKKYTCALFICSIIFLAFVFVYLYLDIENVFQYIIENYSSSKIQDDDRINIYSKAIDLWKTDWKTTVFGSGIVSEIDYRETYGNMDNAFLVYHSTFFEMLVMGGIVGIVALCVHFFEKYRQLWKREKAFALVMLVGYLCVDAYGMMDNTYGMYYYMIPLVIIMASIDVDKNTDIFNNKYELQNSIF